MVELVGRRDALEGVDRLGIAARDEPGAAEVVPEARRMEGIELHRLLDPGHALLGLPDPGENLALLDHDQVVVRIQAERPVLVEHRLVVVVAQHMHGREHALHVAVVLVLRERDLELALDHAFGLLRVLGPVVAPLLAEDAGLPGVRVRVVGVELDRPRDQLVGARVVLAPGAVVQRLRLEHALVGGHVFRRLALGAVARGRLDAPGQDGDDRHRDLVLQREDVLEVAVVALGPDVPVALGIDQLHRDAHAVAGAAHAALDDELHAELLGLLPYVHGLALELGCPRSGRRRRTPAPPRRSC